MLKINELLKEIINFNENQLQQFEKYYQLLLEEAPKYNLTTILEKEDVYIKHFYDSLLVAKTINLTDQMQVLDIGSGAGFPGIPLKIAFPNLKITLLEPTTKRCIFLNKVIQELSLSNIEVVNERAENYIVEKREQFDLVTARAVAPLNILLELAIPYLKVNHHFIALKGQNSFEELNQAHQALNLLNCRIEREISFELPLNKGKRNIMDIIKIKKTLKDYPRLFAKIKKNPL